MLQEVETEGPLKSQAASCHVDLENKKETDHSCSIDFTDSNGNASSSPCDWLDPSVQLNVPLVDVDKVCCIIRNIVRDWAAEGQTERDQCYRPILEELGALFPNRSKESTQNAGDWTMHPWIHSNCNSLSDCDQLRPVSIPNIHPTSAGITEGFSMYGGDFVEVYGDPSQVERKDH